MSADRAATIFALSSGSGRAGVAIIRLSGTNALAAYAALCPDDPLPPPRRVQRVTLIAPDSDDIIDHGLALIFRAPRSYTGEDVVEFHVHGGPSVIQAMLQTLGRVDGLRMAEAGEFTRRAFENGKIDLTAAEGIGDLVAASTEAQRRQAVNQAGGAFAAAIEDWRARLIRLLAHSEAEIDFPDEDLPDGIAAHARADLMVLAKELGRVLDDRHRGEVIRDGVRVAIIGPPNVGKSCLLNCLARRDVAIVSDQPGTTRDVLEVHLELGGYPVTVWDTAGLRETADRVEAEGVRRALARAAAADVTLALRESGQTPDHYGASGGATAKKRIFLRTKCDLAAKTSESVSIPGEIAVSSKTGAGIGDLLECLVAFVASRVGSAEPAVITRERHRQCLRRAVDALGRAETAVSAELFSEDIRLAVRALESVIGRVDVEQVLDVVFRDFCIGK